MSLVSPTFLSQGLKESRGPEFPTNQVSLIDLGRWWELASSMGCYPDRAVPGKHV